MTDSSQDPEGRPAGPDAPAPADPASAPPPAAAVPPAPQAPAAPQPAGTPPPYAPPPALEPAGPPAAQGTPSPYGSPPTYGTPPYGSPPPAATPAYGSPPPAGTPGGYGAPPGQYPPAPAGYGAQPPPGHQQPARVPGTDGFAIAGFVLSLVGGILLSVIFAVLALTRIRRSGQGGKGLAIAALAISAAWVLIILIGVVALIASGPERGDTGAVTEPGRVSPVDLKVGDCTKSQPAEGEVDDIEVTPCTTPHVGEVYAVFELPAGDFPGQTAVEQAAEKGCDDRIPAALEDAGADVGRLSAFYVYPQRANWLFGDRTVTCLVVSEEGPLTAPLLP